MRTSDTDGSSAIPGMGETADSAVPPAEAYTTDSGVTVDITDIEVDVVPSEGGDVISSQADVDAYNVPRADHGDNPPP